MKEKEEEKGGRSRGRRSIDVSKGEGRRSRRGKKGVEGEREIDAG